MWSTARNIAAGDLVIIWLTRDSVIPLVVEPGKEFNGKFGVYSHSDLVGIPYGSKIGSRNGKGFIHALRPTPELWTIALPHRTQILYLADIAFIVSYLDIKPGSQVVEAGTGSGSFSHSVARTIGTKGHLYTYEFHELRANKAREEFRKHGLSEIITLTHRNVCKDGFTVVDQADSVFLDLPAPWDAVGHAKRALRKDRATRICCFSPCMEQVLRTVATLNDAGFTDIVTYETLLRPHEVHSVPTLQPIDEISNKLKQQEVRREYKRQQQIAASQAKKRKRSARDSEDSKVKDVSIEIEDSNNEAGDSGSETKKMRTGNGDLRGGHAGLVPPGASEMTQEPTVEPSQEPPFDTAQSDSLMGDATESQSVVVEEPAPESPEPFSVEASKMVVSRVVNEVRGHTSYLTFAALLPRVLPSENPHILPNSNKESAEDEDVFISKP